MGNLGATELLLIFLVVLIFFGARRIPEIARGLGKGIREFKDATTDIKRELTVEEQHRLHPPAQPGAARYDQAGAYAAPRGPVDYSTPAAQPAPTVYTGGAPVYDAPADASGPYTPGDASAGLPATGTSHAPYPPTEANDTPPPARPA